MDYRFIPQGVITLEIHVDYTELWLGHTELTKILSASDIGNKSIGNPLNKKVLRLERKRHTACRVVSARYAALSPDGVRGGGGRVPHPVPIQPRPDLGWVPLYKCERTDTGENISSRHPSDAGGKNRKQKWTRKKPRSVQCGQAVKH